MKKLILFLALTSMITGCSSDSTTDSQSQNLRSVLIGKWTIEKTIEYMADGSINQTINYPDRPCYQMGRLEINADNSWIAVTFDFAVNCVQNPPRSGSWTLQGNNINFFPNTVNPSDILTVIDNNTIRFRKQNTDPNPYYAYSDTEYKRVN